MSNRIYEVLVREQSKIKGTVASSVLAPVARHRAFSESAAFSVAFLPNEAYMDIDPVFCLACFEHGLFYCKTIIPADNFTASNNT